MVFTSFASFLSSLVLPSTFLLIYDSFHVDFYHMFVDPSHGVLFAPFFVYSHTEDDSSMNRNV